ncbi:M14 family zinc carboxypeptidase [Candidatus Hodarchaeum mangrovi]
MEKKKYFQLIICLMTGFLLFSGLFYSLPKTDHTRLTIRLNARIMGYNELLFLDLIYNNQYHTPEELFEELEQINTTFPELVDLFTIGESIQGRSIYCLRITNEKSLYPKANALFVAQHHAREQITVEVGLRFILRLLNNYGKDTLITSFIDNLDIYIIPSMNPDGLNYVVGNRTGLAPNEWLRKNLRPFDDDNDGLFDEDSAEDVNDDGIISGFEVYKWNIQKEEWVFSHEYYEGKDNDGDGLINEDQIGGVDLNRNYDYRWNDSSLDTGTGSDTKDETYPGTSSFSEPEIQAYRNFVVNKSFAAAISLHSGINATYFPWASTSFWAKSVLYYSIYNDLEALLPPRFWDGGHVNQGAGIESLSYTSAGDWGDWMYAKQNCIVPMTFEIYHNKSSDYFIDLFMENETHQIWEWYGMYGYFAPVQSAIEALWEDISPAFEYWLDLTPRLYIIPKKITGNPTEGSVVSLTLILKNLSPHLETIDRIFIADKYMNPYMSGKSELSFSEIDPLESKTISFDITLNSTITTENNLTFLVGNDYIGYSPISITKSQISETTSIEIYSTILTIPLLIYFKKKQ